MLFVYDQHKDSFKLPPTTEGLNDEAAACRYPAKHDSIVYRIMRGGLTVIASDVSIHETFKNTSFAEREQVKSCLAVPLQIGGEPVGVLFVNDRVSHNFTESEQTNIELLAKQAAVAISNARLYQQEQRRANALQILHEAGKEITGTLDEREILNRIVKQVWKLAQKQEGRAAIRKVEGELAVLDSTYPTPPDSQEPISLRRDGNCRIGITGRCVEEKKTQLVGDVTKDPDYLKFYSHIRSELSLPVLIDDEVAYVVNLEHPDFYAFDEEDARTLESLATQAGIAIQNARKYESLMQAQMLVKLKNDLLWLALAGGIWEHAVRGHAINIRDEVQEVCCDTQKNNLSRLQVERLAKIERLANKILTYQIVPPLPSSNSVPSVSINDFLTEELRMWQETEDVSFELRLFGGDPLLVCITPEWLREACDKLINNAVKAVASVPKRKVTIETRCENGFALIDVSDTGLGISENLIDKLLVSLIPQKDGDKGTGAGLLIADTIAQNFGGKVSIGRTGKSGTTMIIRLPLETE